MRTISLLIAAAAAAMLLPTAASGAVHVVAPGETLWQIAVADGLPLSSLAAANGLDPETHVLSGSTLTIPAIGAAPATAAAARPAAAGASARPATTQAPAPLGAYTIRWGDTLTALAARSGVPLAQMAYMNGLDPSGTLLAGTIIKLPTGSPVASASAPASSRTVVPSAAPSATPERVTSAQIAQIAAANGVPASLAASIAWQESGFNNGFVSPANARGVMQLLPGTWDFVQSTLPAGVRLNPASAADNVRAGVLYLGRLLRETGGDPTLATAAYYQGLGSVRQVGLLPETRRYVADVLALRPRFGG